MIIAMIGSPMKSITLCSSAFGLLSAMSTTVFTSMMTTGSRITDSVVSTEGDVPSSRSVTVYCFARFSGGSGCTRLEIQVPYSGPPMMAVGIATMTPNSSVVPRSACRALIATSGPGCGGIRPCRIDRPASAGMPMRRIEPPVRFQTR